MYLRNAGEKDGRSARLAIGNIDDETYSPVAQVFLQVCRVCKISLPVSKIRIEKYTRDSTSRLMQYPVVSRCSQHIFGRFSRHRFPTTNLCVCVCDERSDSAPDLDASS